MPQAHRHPPERIAEYVAAGWWHDDAAWTWDALFRARVSERGDAVAVVDPANRESLLGSPPRRPTWVELDAEVDALAAVLAARGIGPGAVVGTQLPNTVELVVAYLAVTRLGAVVSPFPMPWREHELAPLGASAGLRAVVTVGSFGDRRHAAEARASADGWPGDVAVLAWGPDLPAGVESLDGLPAATVPRLKQHPADVVTLCWTSGTEATPKGVPRCANSWTVIGRGCAAAPGLTAADVILSPFPLVNMAGFGGIFVPWLLTGATLVQHHPFDLPTYLRQIATERVTYTLAPPALLTGMLRAPGLLDAADLSSLRVVGSGSAPLSGALIREWRDRFGIEVTNFFGSNEGIPLISDQLTVPDPDARAAYFPWFGGPGRTWPNPASAGVCTRLVDLTTGEDVTEPGRPGELRVAGPTIMSGYWGGAGDPFDDQGFYRSGDVFAIADDDPTLLRYVDRARDIVVRGGMNISPAELEALIVSHPAVAEVAVVGVPDEVLGERTAAVVVLAPDTAAPTLDDLVAMLRERKVASYKLPERLAVVDALPRNPLGKVLKRELRTWLSSP
ncbi:class I adenylate-forming enzyme family protein [Pseudonocardia abyssalis]|uniref:Acyl--CoA ligase n=1 Tax=Pseudonocardia abyssalis TaxID=2792008 RepID=A0ABS6V105_9PSEU|nr:class I adenylate-forming enzyme family protein [Pseudonocardia abyssalis]MBW0114502.1 acyl--CoA ligase [Pseudonocardia abyssalis]MBW0138190.1 acyl--CoA ligase [Pseudonocardia abyssalis]